MSDVSADDVSRAIVVWLARDTSPWPKPSEERVVAEFGEEAAFDLLPCIKSLKEQFFQSDADLTERTPRWLAMEEESSRDFREVHPEISDEAISALAWFYVHTNK